MMERKYQLVAWTENITGKENARLYMIPSLECEVQAELVTDLTFIHMEEYKFDGPVSRQPSSDPQTLAEPLAQI